MTTSEKKIQLQFFGAAGTVTGSKTLLTYRGYNVLVDCGLFQGYKKLRQLNWHTPPFDVHTLDAIIITHGHLDHCGYLPLLVKSGYKGPIFVTEPTADIVELILYDSAKIQEEDAEYANRKGYSKHKPALPLYTAADVAKTVSLLEIVPLDDWFAINKYLRFRLKLSGHILGSAWAEVEVFGRKILFSGDIGRQNPMLLPPAVSPEYPDIIVLESTYGDRLHTRKSPYDEIEEAVTFCWRTGGTLLIPSFAVERAQEILYILFKLFKKNRIPRIPVFLDSPMGVNATQIFMNYPEWHKLSPEEVNGMVNEVSLIKDFKDTVEIAALSEPKIIIAGSGMLTGGRILYYLEKYMEDKKNLILLTGYQSPGTRGSLLKEGTASLKFHGKYFKVQAEIRSIEGLSAHADQAELLAWVRSSQKFPGTIFLNHGEQQALEALSQIIEDTMSIPVTIPEMGKKYLI
jgi:metallo-beta-lactamase family protein